MIQMGNPIPGEHFSLEGSILDAMKKTNVSGNGGSSYFLCYPGSESGKYEIKIEGEDR